ncbi:MAG: hypothetical protein AVDCRST_MAG01-01-4440, partial [uncultured Rubrobacteraceae bacterium]
ATARSPWRVFFGRGVLGPRGPLGPSSGRSIEGRFDARL